MCDDVSDGCFCKVCGKTISVTDKVLYDGLCTHCFIDWKYAEK